LITPPALNRTYPKKGSFSCVPCSRPVRAHGMVAVTRQYVRLDGKPRPPKVHPVRVRERKFQYPCEVMYALLKSGKRLQCPSQLSEVAMQENYRFHSGARQTRIREPAEVIERVLLGLKPMGVICMRKGSVHHVREKVLKGVLGKLGLECHVSKAPDGATEAFVFQPGATLSQFYDAREVVSEYTAAGVRLTEAPFNLTVGFLVARFCDDRDFWGQNRPLLHGLLQGYPVLDTIRLCRETPHGRATSGLAESPSWAG